MNFTFGEKFANFNKLYNGYMNEQNSYGKNRLRVVTDADSS